MIRSLLVIAILVTLLIPASLLSTTVTSAQCSYAPGTPVQLVGTPHLFIADGQGILHWGGDTRALAGKLINWSDQCTVGLSELTAANRGDPWLTAGLPKIGEPIYLAKWEDTDAAPTLLHIQTIADVELFGINTTNYGNFVLDRATWEQRFGFNVGTLKVGPLASAASFAWSDTDRAAYGQLLTNMQGTESAALSQAISSGADAVAVLPGIANCEKQGLDTFEGGRNSSNSLQRTTDCLSRGGFAGQVPPPSSGQLSTPLNVRIFPGSAGLQIVWDQVAGATGYRIYGGDQTVPASTFVEFAQPGQTATIAGLVVGTTYCYSVSAFTQTGESMVSAPVCSMATSTGSNPPSAPGNLQVIQVSATSVQLSWTDTSNIQDGYSVFEGANLIATVPSNNNQWTIGGWDATIQHCYQVMAFNEFGQSGGSNITCVGAAAATAQPTPTTVAAVATPTVAVATPVAATPTLVVAATSTTVAATPTTAASR